MYFTIKSTVTIQQLCFGLPISCVKVSAIFFDGDDTKKTKTDYGNFLITLKINIMTKKIIGLCLIVLGCVIFVITAYNLFLIVSQPVESVTKTSRELANIEEQLRAQGLPDKQIEDKMSAIQKSKKPNKIVDLLIVCIAIGISVGGIILLNGGMKETQLSNKFKFD